MSGDLAARVRAALGWDGRTEKELLRDLHTSRSTLSRWKNGSYTPSPAERKLLTEVTGVPAWFLEEGFPESPPESSDIQERLALLEREMAWVKRRVGHGAPPPQGGLRRLLEADQPSPEDHPRSGSDRAADVPRGNGSS